MTHQSCPLYGLGSDIHGHIFEWLTSRELAKAESVCKNLRSSLNQDQIWRRRYQQDAVLVDKTGAMHPADPKVATMYLQLLPPLARHIPFPLGFKPSTDDRHDFLASAKMELDHALFGQEAAKRLALNLFGLRIQQPQKWLGRTVRTEHCHGRGRRRLIEAIGRVLGRPVIVLAAPRFNSPEHALPAEYAQFRTTLKRAVAHTGIMNPVVYIDGEMPAVRTWQKELIQKMDCDLSMAWIFYSHVGRTPRWFPRESGAMLPFDPIAAEDRITIARSYLLPEVLNELALTNNAVIISDKTIRHIIDAYTDEQGCSRLDEHLRTLFEGAVGQSKPFFITPEYVAQQLKQ